MDKICQMYCILFILFITKALVIRGQCVPCLTDKEDICNCCMDLTIVQCEYMGLKDYPIFSKYISGSIVELILINNSISTPPFKNYTDLMPNLKVLNLKHNDICVWFNGIPGIEIIITVPVCGQYFYT